MKLWTNLAFLTILVCTTAHAEKPSEASVKELLVLSNSQQVLQNVGAQLDGMTKNMMKTIMKDKPITAEQQKIIDKFQQKIVAIQKQEITWEKLEPVFVEIYSNSLSQEDVDGISAFYKSPAGKSFVSKMPAMMQQSFAAMQKLLVPMVEKMGAAGKEMGEEMQKLETK